jgi:hypothetical protein
MEPRPLYIPVILGTTRMGRMSARVARLLTEEVSKQAGVETDLIDIAGLPLPTTDAGEAIKEGAFSKMDRGARVIQNLLPVMRELGLVTIFWDVNFSAV